MTYPYRCTRNRCRKRRSLPKHTHQYIKTPICRVCVGKLSFDKTKRKRTKRDTCTCDGISYPHFKGTEPWCVYAKIGPTEEDFKERHHGLPNW